MASDYDGKLDLEQDALELGEFINEHLKKKYGRAIGIALVLCRDETDVVFSGNSSPAWLQTMFELASNQLKEDLEAERLATQLAIVRRGSA